MQIRLVFSQNLVQNVFWFYEFRGYHNEQKMTLLSVDFVYSLKNMSRSACSCAFIHIYWKILGPRFSLCSADFWYPENLILLEGRNLAYRSFSKTFDCSELIKEAVEKVWNMFKVNKNILERGQNPENVTCSNSTILTHLLHDLTCVVPRVRGLHYTIVTSTSVLGMDCPTPYISILNQRCIQTFNC